MTSDPDAGPPSADTIDGSFVPVRRASVASLEVGGDVVLLDADTGRVHHLDPLAGIVWACFDGSGTISEIVADISAEFAADSSSVGDDVLDLARDLGDGGLLDGISAAPDPAASGVYGHGPDLCEEHDHDWDPDQPTLLSHRLSIAHAAAPFKAPAGAGAGAEEPRFLAEPPSS